MELFIKSWCNFDWEGMILTWYYMDGTMVIEDYSGDIIKITTRKVGQRYAGDLPVVPGFK